MIQTLNEPTGVGGITTSDSVHAVLGFMAKLGRNHAKGRHQKLVGYSRVKVAANGTTMLHVDLDPDGYRTWDPETSAWTQWKGNVELRVGTSSRHIAHRIAITL